MRRRDLVKAAVISAVTWPLAARAQEPSRMRRIAVLMAFSESNPEFRSFIDTFMQGLTQLGWVDGRNVQIEVRWAGGDVGRMRDLAKQLVELQPDVIVASTTPVTAALQRRCWRRRNETG
jgi:putative tryptophan/tyrosine transport system substrate-binding protein